MNTAVWGIPGFSRDMFTLFLHRLILRLALGLTNVFTVVFFYEAFNNSISAALSVFLVSFMLTLVLTPLSARFLAVYGVRGLLLAALPFLVLAFAGPFVYAYGGIQITPLIAGVIFAVGAAIYRALYWVPYHISIAASAAPGGVGRQLAVIYNASDLLEVAMPLLGGFLLAGAGYEPLFALALVAVALSMVPLFWVSTRYETFQWGYAESFRHVFAPANRTLFLAHFSDGIQATVLGIIWPLLIFVMFLSGYEVLGAITTLTFLAILLIRTGTGYLMDRWDKKRVMYWGALFAASGWVMKLFVGTPVQIVMVDTYHGFGRVIQQTAFATISYEQAADNGTYIDEYTVLKEIAIHTGRGFVLVMAILGYLWLGISVAFALSLLLAACASFATIYLSQRGVVY